MGVPGFLLWGLAHARVRAVPAAGAAGSQAGRRFATRRGQRLGPGLLGGDDGQHTFDPYLEAPQGGIWFWALFGLGLVLIRLAPDARRPNKRRPNKPAPEQTASEQTTPEQTASEQAAQ